ncbi:shikimate dehydrogenase [Buchnera aphidicola (Ceratoglyphina bambusae)]|uniref:shikimate dehydrogenase n=1 Tax=Buchnera aphidicola TaxID=9 RepID=UPI0031B8B208
MDNRKKYYYALFGNPVNHSLSPIIHKIFSKQINLNYNYKTILTPKNCLKKFLDNFFKKSDNLGANITLPFKTEVLKYVDNITKKAKISGAINTLKKINEKHILGDNTDGVGIIYDLRRLNFLKKKCKILLIGAGGAAQGIIPYLLLNKNIVFIYNRTFLKALNLEKKFCNIGNIICLKKECLKNNNFDLVINATSSGVFGGVPNIPKSIISENVFCYDLYFDLLKETPFIKWCKKNGAINVKDGIGMLVGQAAYSCYLWNKKFPDVKKTIKILQKNI